MSNSNLTIDLELLNQFWSSVAITIEKLSKKGGLTSSKNAWAELHLVLGI